jgi:hypothetical protein
MPPLRPELVDEYVRFVSGDAFRLSELEFRVVQGRKAPDDLVLQWLTPTGWFPIRFDVLGLLVDFLYDNEGRLYPRWCGYRGGEKVVDYVRRAVDDGWRDAWRHLNCERSAKSSQLELALA